MGSQMFDFVLSKSPKPHGNIAGLGLSLLIYGVLGLVGVWLLSPRKANTDRDVEVTLFTAPSPAPPPPPPPPPAGGVAQSRPVEHRPVEKKPETVVEAKTPVPEQPQPAESANAESGGVPGGVAGGVAGGVIGGVPGGVVGGTPGGTGNAVVPFGPGMVRPQPIQGGKPEYTPSATAARVEGKVIARCVITAAGEAVDCKIIKSVPMLDEIVLDTLRQARYSPATFQGSPISVQYLLTFNFKLP
jgi:periplasmic protein TonB